MTITEAQSQVFFDIRVERQRQVEKWGDQSHNPQDVWAVILGEEYGEVCKEVLELGIYNGKLRKELIEVAAVAVAWIEAIDGNISSST